MVDADAKYLIKNLDTGKHHALGSVQNSNERTNKMDCHSDYESESDMEMEIGFYRADESVDDPRHTTAATTSDLKQNRRGSGLGLFSTFTSLISRGRSHIFSRQNGSESVTVGKEEEPQILKMCKEDFTMLRVIGKGSFAKVILVKKKGSDQLYAMKVLSKPAVVKRKQVEHTKTERRVLEVVGHLHDHPYISQLHYAFQTDSKLYLVLHYCAGGEVFHHLQRMKRFPERWARLYAAELVLALSHLHQYSVAYRDLKPENILLDVEGHVKLCDFGLSKDNVSQPTAGAMSLCGTPEYLAPEVLDRSGHGTCVDWWGMGMVLYELLTGLPPWYTTDRKKLFSRIRSAPLKFPAFAASNMSPEVRTLITQLLNRDPAARLGGDGNVRAIKDHPFFTPACGMPATSAGHPRIEWEAIMQRQVPSPFRPDAMVAAEPQRYSHEQRAFISREPGRYREHTHVPVQELQQLHAHASAASGASGGGSEVVHDPTDSYAALAKNFDPEHARLPFDSEASGGGSMSGMWGTSSYASPDNDGMFANFTFDEGNSPHLSLEEAGKTLSSLLLQEETAPAKRIDFKVSDKKTSQAQSVDGAISPAEVEVRVDAVEIESSATVSKVTNVQPCSVGSPNSGSLLDI